MSNLPAEADAKKLVEEIYSKREECDLAEVFLSAVDIEEILRLGRQRTELAVLTHIPAIVETLAAKAKEGDIKAAKTLLEVAGLLNNNKGGGGAVVANQINISPQELAQLERELYDVDRVNN